MRLIGFSTYKPSRSPTDGSAMAMQQAMDTLKQQQQQQGGASDQQAGQLPLDTSPHDAAAPAAPAVDAGKPSTTATSTSSSTSSGSFPTSPMSRMQRVLQPLMDAAGRGPAPQPAPQPAASTPHVSASELRVISSSVLANAPASPSAAPGARGFAPLGMLAAAMFRRGKEGSSEQVASSSSGQAALGSSGPAISNSGGQASLGSSGQAALAESGAPGAAEPFSADQPTASLDQPFSAEQVPLDNLQYDASATAVQDFRPVSTGDAVLDACSPSGRPPPLAHDPVRWGTASRMVMSLQRQQQWVAQQLRRAGRGARATLDLSHQVMK